MATRPHRLRRRLLAGACSTLFAVAGPVAHAARVYVVVAANSPIGHVTEKELVALFTGRSRTLAGGIAATPLDLPRDGPARADFYQSLTGMDIARINSYWARLQFTGQVQPPQAMSDEAAVAQRLRSDPTTIGYLTHEPADGSVRVLLRLP